MAGIASISHRCPFMGTKLATVTSTGPVGASPRSARVIRDVRADAIEIEAVQDRDHLPRVDADPGAAREVLGRAAGHGDDPVEGSVRRAMPEREEGPPRPSDPPVVDRAEVLAAHGGDPDRHPGQRARQACEHVGGPEVGVHDLACEPSHQPGERHHAPGIEDAPQRERPQAGRVPPVLVGHRSLAVAGDEHLEAIRVEPFQDRLRRRARRPRSSDEAMTARTRSRREGAAITLGAGLSGPRGAAGEDPRPPRHRARRGSRSVPARSKNPSGACWPVNLVAVGSASTAGLARRSGAASAASSQWTTRSGRVRGGPPSPVPVASRRAGGPP